MKFDNFIDINKDKIINIYFDMDGVLAEYDIGNFDYDTIRPINTVINKMKELIDLGCNVEILSICKNNKIVEEKYKWLKENMPFFDKNKANFLSKEEYEGYESNELKSKFLKDNTNEEDINILIDDDSQIIKKVVKENKNIKVFHVSSLIY